MMIMMKIMKNISSIGGWSDGKGTRGWYGFQVSLLLSNIHNLIICDHICLIIEIFSQGLDQQLSTSNAGTRLLTWTWPSKYIQADADANWFLRAVDWLFVCKVGDRTDGKLLHRDNNDDDIADDDDDGDDDADDD